MMAAIAAAEAFKRLAPTAPTGQEQTVKSLPIIIRS
jgi:hypothetical protein